MIQITKKQDCSGCNACAAICPKQCISMKIDNEGFLYPITDIKKCINCNLCENVCQSINPIKHNNSAIAYAAYNINEEIRMMSSSGGMFTLIAEYIIDKGGAVFGAAFDDDLNVHHICVNNKEDLQLLRGSKYLQSTIGNAYQKAKEILLQDRYVLFTGTPCQIDGLFHYLNKEYDKLYTQDIICHGVPSSMVWQKYLTYQESLLGGKVDKVSSPSFRRKDEGWKRYSVALRLTTKQYETEYRQTFDEDLYMKAFLSNISLRPSCYSCHSKTLNRNSDITIADFWGIEKIIPEMFDDKGTSLVFVNTKKGAELFENTNQNLIYKSVNINDAVKSNISAYKSVDKPNARKRFFKCLNKTEFDILVRKCTKVNFLRKVITKSRQYYVTIFNNRDI